MIILFVFIEGDELQMCHNSCHKKEQVNNDKKF